MKIIVSIISNPTPNREFRKKQQKNSKNYKTPLWLISQRTHVGKSRERVKIKIIILIISYPTPNRELKKKVAKNILKIKKHHFGFFFKPKQVGTGREGVRIKIIVPIISYLTRNSELKKIAKKFRKLKNTTMACFQAKTGW